MTAISQLSQIYDFNLLQLYEDSKTLRSDSAQKGHTAAQQVKFVNSISIPLHIVPACTYLYSVVYQMIGV